MKFNLMWFIVTKTRVNIKAKNNENHTKINFIICLGIIWLVVTVSLNNVVCQRNFFLEWYTIFNLRKHSRVWDKMILICILQMILQISGSRLLLWLTRSRYEGDKTIKVYSEANEISSFLFYLHPAELLFHGFINSW